MAMARPAELPANEDLLVCIGTHQAHVIKTLFDAIKALTVNGNLLFFPSGFRICNVAATHVAFVEMPASRLDTYHYGSTRAMEPVGVDFELLWKFVKTLGQKDTVHFYVTKADDARLVILKSDLDGTTSYSVPMLDIDEDVYERPPFEGEFFHVTFSAARMSTTLKEMRNAGGTLVQFLAERGDTADHLYTVASGDDFNMQMRRHDPIPHTKTVQQPIMDCGDSDDDDAEEEEEEEEEEVVVEGATASAAATDTDNADFDEVFHIEGITEDTSTSACDKQDQYSLAHLMEMVKASAMSRLVRLHLRPEFPLLLSFSVGTLGTVFFAVSARVESIGTSSLAELRNVERRSACALGVASLADAQDREKDAIVVEGLKRVRKQERGALAKKPRLLELSSDEDEESIDEEDEFDEEADGRPFRR